MRSVPHGRKGKEMKKVRLNFEKRYEEELGRTPVSTSSQADKLLSQSSI